MSRYLMYANSHSTACAHSAGCTAVAEKAETLMGEPDLCMPTPPQARLAKLAACYGNNFQAGVGGKMTLAKQQIASLFTHHVACSFSPKQRASLWPRCSKEGAISMG